MRCSAGVRWDVCHHFRDIFAIQVVTSYFSDARVQKRVRRNMGSFIECYLYQTFLTVAIIVTFGEGLSIDLSNQNLEIVPGFLNTSVTSLTLDGNILETLNATSFHLYSMLEILLVRRCQTKYIKDGTFTNQDRLITIDFSRCSIVKLPSSLGPSTETITTFGLYSAYGTASIFKHPYFSEFQKLRTLDIGGVNLGHLDSAILPSSLIALRISGTQMSSFPNIGHQTPYLDHINLVNNAISVIPQEAIDKFSKIRVLRLGQNVLESFPNVSHHRTLKAIFMNGNRIKHVRRSLIEGLMVLEFLSLSQNRINLMPDLSHLPRLRKITLNTNYLRYVPASCLEGLKIELFDLRYNRITFIEDFPKMTPSIDLRNNMMTTLPDLYDSNFVSLELENNPLFCNQSLCWLRMWPFDKPLPVLDNVLCSSPPDRNGTMLMRVHPTLLKCYEGKCGDIIY